MHTKYFLIYQRTNGQILKSLAKLFPNFQSVFLKCSFATIFETVYLIDKSALVVSSEQIYESWVSQFVRKKQGDNLNIILVSVDIVSLKQIFFVRGRPNLVEKTDKVLQLPMNVSRNNYWRLYFNNYGLLF